MNQKKALPETQIPEVMEFLEAKQKLDRLREAFPEVFEQLYALREEYNAKLEAAEKIVRAQKVSCGPFDLYQWQTKYNAERLYEELGRDEFLRIGGKIQTVTQYDVDKNKLEAHITAGAVPEEVVSVVKDTSPRYKKPEKINI